MSSPVQRTYNRPTLLGSIPSPCPPIVPPFVTGGNLEGDGPPSAFPPNIASVWFYYDRVGMQIWSWNTLTLLWS